MKKIHIILLFLTVGVAFQSCKKYFDPPLVFEKDPGSGLTKARKVMLISIDGLSGIELEKYQPEHIKALLPKSKYSFGGFSDANTTDASSWTSMISGKNSGKHGVVYEDFENETEEDPDDPHGNEGNTSSTGYISVYQRLLESGKRLKSLSLTSWQPLADKIFTLSDEFKILDSDESVKKEALERLKNDEENSSFVLINFRGLIEAGKSGGFSLENNEYKSQLDVIDGYIGEIIQALKDKPSYDGEDWMVIITSNHGGLGDTYGGASFEERKIPFIFYNERFEETEFNVPELGQYAHLSGSWSSPVRALIPAEKAEAFNFGTEGEYTVQMKMNLKSRGGTWPGFFGKKSTTLNDGSSPGWAYMLYDPSGSPKWRPFIGHQSSGPVSQLSNLEIQPQEWTTLTMKIFEEDGKRKVRGFTNDDIHVDFEITGRDLSNNEPLILGGMPGWISTTATFDVSDIRIYKKALPDEYIQNTYCQEGVTEEDDYYEDLIGYWPVEEGAGNVLKDKINNADFVFERPTSWTIAANNLCNLPIDEELLDKQRILNSIDLLPQIFYWLEVETHDSWDLEGEVFLDGYEKEFITN